MNEEEWALLASEIRLISNSSDMYGDYLNMKNYQKSKLMRMGLNLSDVAKINSLRIAIDSSIGKDYLLGIKRDLSGKSQPKKDSEEYLENIRISDELEKMLGREGFIKVFFTGDEKSSYYSAVDKYKHIEDSSEPKVRAYLDELNPEKLYNHYKYKIRYKYFARDGVEKILASPMIGKKQKQFLIFNLDQLDSEEGKDGQIEINFKEWIYSQMKDREANNE